MMSQTLCTVSGASIPLTHLRLPRLFKPSRTVLERNGSYNSKANSSHSYDTIKTTPKMSDDTGSDGTHATEPREYPPIRPREQRQVYRRMLNKVTEDIRSRITEEDLHKIFSAPMEKRSSLTSTVNSPDIVWEYVPREQDGLSIPLFTASSILNGVAESALREKLHEIPGLVLSTSFFMLIPILKANNFV